MLSSLGQDYSAGWSLAGNFAFSWPTTFYSSQELYNTINLVPLTKSQVRCNPVSSDLPWLTLSRAVRVLKIFKTVVNFHKKSNSPKLETITSDFAPFLWDERVLYRECCTAVIFLKRWMEITFNYTAICFLYQLGLLPSPSHVPIHLLTGHLQNSPYSLSSILHNARISSFPYFLMKTQLNGHLT